MGQIFLRCLCFLNKGFLSSLAFTAHLSSGLSIPDYYSKPKKDPAILLSYLHVPFCQ